MLVKNEPDKFLINGRIYRFQTSFLNLKVTQGFWELLSKILILGLFVKVQGLSWKCVPTLYSCLICSILGRGMNAAFAIGRLCDLELGRNYLLGLPESERMVSILFNLGEHLQKVID